MDEGQLFYVRSLEKVDQLIERLGRLGFFRGVEGLVDEARQEKSLHHNHVVKSLEKPLVTKRFGMGLHSGEEGSVGPRLVTKE
jgi:hypothetical protein